MGIEIPSSYGGSNSTFFSSILVVEELAKVDGSVSVMCDIQNTLLNTLIMQYGSEHLKSTYLPKMASNTVIACMKRELLYAYTRSGLIVMLLS